MDRLAALLQRFSLSARLFHSGPLCGIVDFAPEEGLGQLHLVRSGTVLARHAGAAPDVEAQGPCLLFYPRPLAHRGECDEGSVADMPRRASLLQRARARGFLSQGSRSCEEEEDG